MKVLLVCPKFPDSLWSFDGMTSVIGIRTAHVPIGLATIAALTPSDWDVEIADENVRALDFDTDADVVGISIFNVQFARALEIAREFQKRGRWVVAGGPYPTLCPEKCAGRFDTVIDGEGETLWPSFCRDFAAGVRQARYQTDDKADLTRSPIPRFDLLDAPSYLYFAIQTSRGCPFTCDFCDIIITDGRRPRAKTVEQVIAEVDAVHRAGGRYVMFGDANLIGDPRFARRLFVALRDWGRANNFPIRFSGEMTINCADQPELLDLLQQANFEGVFLGIESPRPDSLKIASKHVNLRGAGGLVDKVGRFQAHNLAITAGMIVGFDTDDSSIFEEHVRLLDDAAIAFTTVGVLLPLERTPLHGRLQREGRLLPMDETTTQGHGSGFVYFNPKQMTAEELAAGYNWMIRQHYRYDRYRRRVVDQLRRFRKRRDPAVRAAGRMTLQNLIYGARVFWHYLTAPAIKRRFFFGTVWDIVRSGVSMQKLVVGFSLLIVHKHFHEYVTRAHGDPETLSAWQPPRTSREDRSAPAA